MKHIPNFITSLNLASGFIALIYAARGDVTTASWLILAAMIFDFFDGFSARILKAYTEIGKELDSLADVVSFGVAPAFIIYIFISSSAEELNYAPSGIKAAIASKIAFIALLMPVCAALRLAKFNTDPTQTSSFKGLPTPANAIGVISLVISASYSDSALLKLFTGAPFLLAIYTMLLSFMMVTRLPLMSLKIKSIAFKGNEGRYILGGLVLISFAVMGIAASTLIIPFYLLSSLISSFFWPVDPID